MKLNPHLFRRIKLVISAPTVLEKLRAELLQASRVRERANERYRQKLDRAESIQDEIDARQPYILAQRAEDKAGQALRDAQKQYLMTGKITLPGANLRLAKKQTVTKLHDH